MLEGIPTEGLDYIYSDFGIRTLAESIRWISPFFATMSPDKIVAPATVVL